MSFINGKIAEDLVEGLFKDLGCDTERAKGEFPDWDLKCKLKRKKFTAEIKYDIMACLTGNLAIEFRNSKQNKPSGIEATKANLWVHCIKDGEHITIWITSVSKLKEYIAVYEPRRTVFNAGDDNADLYLYKDDEILSIFTKIDHLDEKGKLKAIRSYL